jgi:CelD/BcsL family acetyltransferase involved in cellulose biosynthesis
MTLRIHDQWSTETFDRAPVAAGTGPFPRRAFLRAWWRERGGAGPVMLADTGSALLPLVSIDDRIEFMGEADLCDYHTPLGSGIADLAAELGSQLPDGARLSLDSLPAEAAHPIAAGLRAAAIDTAVTQHQAAAVLSLPKGTDEWYGSLAKKQRHEVRRKIRRFTAAVGTPALSRGSGADLAVFAAMHRAAEGDKGRFMDEAMERWFTALIDEVGARIDLLSGDDGVPLAGAIGFEDDGAYYLYNSAYEPAASDVSPGVVLLTELVARAISEERAVFDFLKGDEPYKFKLGAEPRPLYAVTATIGRTP